MLAESKQLHDILLIPNPHAHTLKKEKEKANI